MLTSDSKSTALSAELRAHLKEWDYYCRFSNKNEAESTTIKIIKIT
jgi:hypothetical protein